jgi:signal transduction histidine kinase
MNTGITAWGALAVAWGATLVFALLWRAERKAAAEVESGLRLQLEAAQQRWRASLEVRDAFLARMSHELRTPLNAILGYSELLSEDLENGAAEDLGRIRSSALHLQALVTTILDLTQLQSGSYAMQPEQLDLASSVQSVVDAVRAEAEARGNTVKVQVEPELTATLDRRMVQSILFNLVSNACRTTSKGVVSVRAAREHPWLTLTVADTGIGLTARQVEAAFALFEPGAQRDARYDGTGVGLAVVREFAEAMGGSARVDGGPGTGARIRVSLPLDATVTPRSGSMLEEQTTTLTR